MAGPLSPTRRWHRTTPAQTTPRPSSARPPRSIVRARAWAWTGITSRGRSSRHSRSSPRTPSRPPTRCRSASTWRCCCRCSARCRTARAPRRSSSRSRRAAPRTSRRAPDVRDVIDHPLRGRFNAWLLDALDAYMNGKYGALKARLLADPPATVVEIGPGTGANFRYYPAGTRVVAIEPNVRMHPRLARSAAKRGLVLELRTEGAEATGLASGSVPLVFASLVLCSVRDPTAVAREVRRMLAPGGRFVCVEHVA